MEIKDFFSKKRQVKETSNIIGLEAGSIKSFLDSWTFTHALLELSDNANDAGASKFEVVLSNKNGKTYLLISYDGKPFTYNELFDYLKIFSYHNALGTDITGLKGCGRRWAFYTFCGYKNWNTPKTSKVSVFSYNKRDKQLHSGTLIIRYPKQEDEDVIMHESIDCPKWETWFTNSIIIELERPIRLEEFASEVEASYPERKKTKFIINDKIEGFNKTIYPTDRTYSVDMLKDEKLWTNVGNGITEIENEAGTALLSFGKAPCGKKFKIITVALKTSYVKEMGERTANGGAKHVYGGLYALRGNRFIVHGNSKHLGNLLPDRGGCGNCRTLVDLSDDDIARDFGVKTNKSLGIENLENSPELNPNNTRLEGTSEERRTERITYSKKNSLGVYDYILNSSRRGYKIYCDKYTKPIVKTSEAKNNKPKQTSDFKNKDSVIKEIGNVKAVMPSESFEVTEYGIKTEILETIVDRIFDELELMGVKIPTNAHGKIMNKLCSTNENEEEWAELLKGV